MSQPFKLRTGGVVNAPPDDMAPIVDWQWFLDYVFD